MALRKNLRSEKNAVLSKSYPKENQLIPQCTYIITHYTLIFT